MMRRQIAARLLGACMLAALAACAQDGTRASDPNCPASGHELPMRALYGSWEARIDGQSGTATLLLERHPEYDGVRGKVLRPGQPPAQLAGDIDPEGLLALDESQDGRSISANWSGELQPGSCGQAFKGRWRRASDDSVHSFVLNKTKP